MFLIFFIFFILPLKGEDLSPTPFKKALKAEKVIIQGLNKVTGKTFIVRAYVNQQINFGTLRIFPRKAYQSQPEDIPESYCCLEIWEEQPEAGETLLFSGWMVASSPHLMALEHPVYDVWITGTILPQREEPLERLPQT